MKNMFEYNGAGHISKGHHCQKENDPPKATRFKIGDNKYKQKKRNSLLSLQHIPILQKKLKLLLKVENKLKLIINYHF